MRFPRSLLACALPALLFAGCSTTPHSPAARSELGAVMAERLALARDVARSKHHSGAPVHDPAREAAILASLTRQATERGLSHRDAESFLTAQIAASRQVQTELLARWACTTPLDLQTELRPRLDTVTTRLLDTLAATHRRGRWTETASHARTALSSAGFSDEAIQTAIAPLDAWASAERHADYLERQRRRMLRPRPALSN